MFRNILITFSSGAISGQLMSELATGMSSDLLNDMRQATGVPSIIPPNPLRSVGVTARIKLAEWESSAEL